VTADERNAMMAMLQTGYKEKMYGRVTVPH
jgi:hypothetical protein